MDIRGGRNFRVRMPSKDQDRKPAVANLVSGWGWAVLFALAMTFVGPLATGHGPAAAQQGSTSGEGSKGKSLTSFVMLADTNWPTPQELQKEIARRIPAYKPVPARFLRRMSSQFAKIKASMKQRLNVEGDDFKWNIVLGSINKRLVTISFTGAPNPLVEGESFFRAAWWWRSAFRELSTRKAHVYISMPVSKDARGDQLLLGQLTAVIIERTKALGVIWETADAVYRAKRFAGMMAEAKKVLPAQLAVSVKLGRDTQFPRKDGKPAWLGATYGLRSMGLKEIEFRGFEGEAPQLVQLLWNVSGYLMQKGDVIGDKDTIGPESQRQYVFRVQKSTLGLQGKVLRMQAIANRVKPDAKDIVRPEDVVK